MRRILCVACLLACCACLAADQPIARVFVWPGHCTLCDPGAQNWPIPAHGDVFAVRADGTKTQITRDGLSREARLSPDHKTIGWLTGAHEGGEHGETLLFSAYLVLYRGSDVIRMIHRGGHIHTWQFWHGGKQVAIASGPPRDIRVYSLYDVATGDLIATRNRFENGEEPTPPAWAKAFAD